MLWAQPLWAELFVWRPQGFSQTFVLYKEKHERYDQAVQRYLRAQNNNPDLSAFSRNLFLSPTDSFRALNPAETTLLLANSYDDHKREAARITEVQARYQDQGLETVILPVGAAEALPQNQKQTFLNEINQTFSLMMALGGDDVHPKFYGEKITWARKLNATRDQAEMDVLQHYIKNSKGKLSGICRGQQLISVVLGYKLNQDLVQDLKTEVKHLKGAFHPARLLKTTHNTLKAAFPHVQSIHINSYHHQSVNVDSLKQNPYLEIALISSDGVVEALESRDGRILLFQFHPEIGDLYPRLGKTLFRLLKKWAFPLKFGSCQKAVAG